MMVLIRHMYVSLVVQALPTLSLFFAGLLIFLFNINHPVFSAVVWCVGFSAAVYACGTLLIQYNSPVLCAAPLNRMAPLSQHLICGHRSSTSPIHDRQSAGINTTSHCHEGTCMSFSSFELSLWLLEPQPNVSLAPMRQRACHHWTIVCMWCPLCLQALFLMSRHRTLM